MLLKVKKKKLDYHILTHKTNAPFLISTGILENRSKGKKAYVLTFH